MLYNKERSDNVQVDYAAIGKRIKEERQNVEITQEELAKMLKISTSFMSGIERGKVKLNIPRLMQISETLNISPGYLLTGIHSESKEYLQEKLKIVLNRCNLTQKNLIYKISELVSNLNVE